MAPTKDLIDTSGEDRDTGGKVSGMATDGGERELEEYGGGMRSVVDGDVIDVEVEPNDDADDMPIGI